MMGLTRSFCLGRVVEQCLCWRSARDWWGCEWRAADALGLMGVVSPFVFIRFSNEYNIQPGVQGKCVGLNSCVCVCVCVCAAAQYKIDYVHLIVGGNLKLYRMVL